MSAPKKHFFFGLKITAIFFCLFLGWETGLSLSSNSSSSKSLTLLFSHDTHGTYKPYKLRGEDGERLVGGMEAASHYLAEIKASEGEVLVIDAGDLMTGTLASEVLYREVPGGAMVEFLNRLGYDLWSVGNHDFDKGLENTLKLASLARFPVIMANIIYKQDGRGFPLSPYHIFERAGLKVGVISFMEENFLQEVHRERVEGLEVLPIIPLLKAYLPVLDKHTDLIVVIVHAPFEVGVEVARNVPEVDLILTAAEDGRFQDVGGVLVKSTNGRQRTLGYLRVEVKEDRVVSHQEKLIWLWAAKGLKPSPEVTELVKEVDALIGSDCTRVIGEAKQDLWARTYAPSSSANSVEIALGSWITDVMRWKAGAQIGLHNSGAIRDHIFKGPICLADIFRVSPFKNTLVVFKLTAQQVKDALELDIERDRDRLQVSGLRYAFFPQELRPYGQRVDWIEIGGEVIAKDGKVFRPDRVFTAVSNDYLVGHAEDKYFGFSVSYPQDTGILLNQVLVEWLEKHKVLDYHPQPRILKK